MAIELGFDHTRDLFFIAILGFASTGHKTNLRVQITTEYYHYAKSRKYFV